MAYPEPVKMRSLRALIRRLSKNPDWYTTNEGEDFNCFSLVYAEMLLDKIEVLEKQNARLEASTEAREKGERDV